MLVFKNRDHRDSQGKWYSTYLCSCGNLKIVRESHVNSGEVVSCGCFRRNQSSMKMRQTMTKHGKYRTREYTSWQMMKGRCTNENSEVWRYYGGRGITVCGRWVNSFENFYADMGPRPNGTSIDRIDVNGNYEPGNCRWATPKEQSKNRRKT